MRSIERTFLLLLCFIVSQGFAQNVSSNKYKEFDFWIGEWNVYKQGTDSIVGKSKIESIVDGMVIKETYHSTTSQYQGTSLNKYNPRIDKWEQFWVDNSGLSLHIVGNLVNGKMVLENQITSKKGTIFNKIEWQKNNDGTVRQTWYQSSDEGTSWKAVFDGEYRVLSKN